MARGIKRSVTLLSIASLAIATGAFAAQPIANGVYDYSSSTFGGGLELQMHGKHLLSIRVTCGAVASRGLSTQPSYTWTSNKTATVKADGSFSYSGKATGIQSVAVNHQQRRTILHGKMTVTGRFTTLEQAIGSATIGKCDWNHFTALSFGQEGPPH